MKHIKKVFVLFVIVGLFSTAACTPYHTQGAVTGGAVGGVTGAFLDHSNPWRGGVIGAALGAVVGATLADISYRASREAYSTGRPVEYRTEDGRGVYRADPEGYVDGTRCRRIHERLWENGRLVKDEIREVCEGRRYERGY
ncbi:MAG: glycine zipper 2TM domain-containing protein [Nitrospirae bacterium]|nr:glycine zipper 2TM domain-containing protein [Nitrospirota bacterium]